MDLDQSFGSKWLIPCLSRLDVSMAEDEVRLYHQSHLKGDTERLNILPNNSSVQWSIDSVDYNMAMLDGKETFHGMGIIAALTPSGSIQQLKDVRKLRKRRMVSKVTKDKGVDIVEYDGSKELPTIKTFNKFESKVQASSCPTEYQDPNGNVRSTTLVQSSRYNYRKRSQHCMLLRRFLYPDEFMGSTGYKMSGFGLEEVWNQVHKENTVPHLMSGKAYSRALKGHVLVHSTFHNILFDEIISNLPQEERLKIESVYDAYYNRECNLSDGTKKIFTKIGKLLVERKVQLAKTNQTAQLWVQILDYSNMVLLFVRAEQLGDWGMHLTITHAMLKFIRSNLAFQLH